MNWDNFFGKLSTGFLVWVFYTFDIVVILMWIFQIFPNVCDPPAQRMSLIWDGVGLIFGTVFAFGCTLLIVEDMEK